MEECLVQMKVACWEYLRDHSMVGMSAVAKATVTVHLMPGTMVQWKAPNLVLTSETRLDYAKASRSAITTGARKEAHSAPHSGHRLDLPMVRTSVLVTDSYLVPKTVIPKASEWGHS